MSAAGRLGPLLARYVVPGRALVPSSQLLRRAVGSLATTRRAADGGASLPVALGLDISDACNLACVVCSREVERDARRRPFLPREDARRILEEVRPGYVSFSGYGETMLHKELAGMVADAVFYGAQVNLVSNGTLLDRRRAEALAEAGLSRLKLSLDAADPALYARVREGAELADVLARARVFQEVARERRAKGLRAPVLEVQMVLCRDNLHDIGGMLALCADDLGADCNFSVMYTYGDRDAFVALTLPRRDPEVLATLAAARDEAGRRGLWRARTSLDAAISSLSTDPSAKACRVPWYSAIVSTDGELYPCCHHTIHGTSVGNVLRDGFGSTWNGAAMQAFRRGLREDRCGDRTCASCPEHDGALTTVLRATGGG